MSSSLCLGLLLLLCGGGGPGALAGPRPEPSSKLPGPRAESPTTDQLPQLGREPVGSGDEGVSATGSAPGPAAAGGSARWPNVAK